ncbi:ice-binding family protein [Nonomuraea sp. NPDC049141]|uniref:ice-binding family protein n=1 Tax=Nonomuraea sp. NPDC049141 TaxID=3155500 RepID=UPI0033C4AF52
MTKNLPTSWLAAVVVGALAMGMFTGEPRKASARQATSVALGDAYDCVAMAGTRITSTQLTTLTGDIAVTPGDVVTGFPPGEVRGEVEIDNAEARWMKRDAVAAYQEAAALPPDSIVPSELGGKTIPPGVHKSADGALRINGTLTLDAKGKPDANFVFQTDSLDTARVSNINLLNGAQADHVIWQVGVDATLGKWSTFRGTVLAWNAIDIEYGAAVYGRTMALHEELNIEGSTYLPATRVTLPYNPPTTTTLTSSPNPSRDGQPVTFTAKVDGDVSGIGPTGTVLFKEGSTVIGSAYADATGIATFTTSGLTRGVHEITAVYVNGGTAVYEAWVYFAPSESPVLLHQVLSRR